MHEKNDEKKNVKMKDTMKKLYVALMYLTFKSNKENISNTGKKCETKSIHTETL